MKRLILFCGLALFITSIVSAEITMDDVSGLWLFDEDAGNEVIDSSGNGNNGEIIGDLSYVDGKFAKGLQLPGESLNLVQIPDSESLNPTTGISISAWGWLDDTGGNRRFLQKSTAGSDNQYRLLLEWGEFKFDAGPGVSPQELTTPIFSTQEWHHIVGTYNGNEMAIYYDGEKVASQDATGEMTPSTGPVFLGAKWNDPGHPGDYWKGIVDELVVFNRGLTEEEVKSLMGGFQGILPVAPKGKVAIRWGRIKTIQ